MRLIDLDAIIKDARANFCGVMDAVLVENFLKEQPIVLDVVCCKDCIHYSEVGDCEVHPHDGRFNVNYFCADGQKKNNALTLEELHDMVGLPVWIEAKEFNGYDIYKGWVVCFDEEHFYRTEFPSKEYGKTSPSNFIE